VCADNRNLLVRLKLVPLTIVQLEIGMHRKGPLSQRLKLSHGSQIVLPISDLVQHLITGQFWHRGLLHKGAQTPNQALCRGLHRLLHLLRRLVSRGVGLVLVHILLRIPNGTGQRSLDRMAQSEAPPRGPRQMCRGSRVLLGGSASLGTEALSRALQLSIRGGRHLSL
jgi:hypothetical protein